MCQNKRVFYACGHEDQSATPPRKIKYCSEARERYEIPHDDRRRESFSFFDSYSILPPVSFWYAFPRTGLQGADSSSLNPLEPYYYMMDLNYVDTLNNSL